MTKTACAMTKNDIILNLKQALNSEYKALDGYDDLLRLIDDDTDRNVIEMIIEDEKRHVKIVEDLINLVNEFGK